MRPGDFLLHPAFALAVIVLVLNDHVLKWTFGNVITGKLSDVAGVFLLPLLMLAFLEGVRRLLRRQRWAANRAEIIGAIAVVGLGFAAVKLVPVVGDAYEYMVGLLRKLVTFSPDSVTAIVVYRDATDVLVLPVLYLSYLVAMRYRRPGTAPHITTRDTTARDTTAAADHARPVTTA